MRRRSIGRMLLCVLAVSGLASGHAAEMDSEWPAWRNDGSGVADSEIIEDRWGPSTAEWISKIPGRGNSSPIVRGSDLYVTSAVPAQLWSLGTYGGLVVLSVLVAFLAVGYLVAREASTSDQRGTLFSVRWRVPGIRLGVSLFVLWVLMRGRSWIDLGNCAVAGCAIVAMLTTLDHRFRAWVDKPLSTYRDPLWNRLLSLAWLSGLATYCVATLGFASTYPISTLEADHQVLGVGRIAIIGLVLIATSSAPSYGTRTLTNLATLGVLVLLPSLCSDRDQTSLLQHFRYTEFSAIVASALVLALGLRTGIDAGFGLRGRHNSGKVVGPALIALSCGVLVVWSVVWMPKSTVLLQVHQLSASTGDLLWSRTCGRAMQGQGLHSANTLATPTPAADEGLVVAHFPGFGACSYDSSGQEIWTYLDPVEPSYFGGASSPLLAEGVAVLTYDVETVSLTIALDAATGQVLWSNTRDGLQTGGVFRAFSTPKLTRSHHGYELVHHSNAGVVAIDLHSGVRSWRQPTGTSQVVASPVQWEDLVVVGGGSRRGYLAAIRTTAGTATVVWEGTRAGADLASPVIANGLVFVVTTAGVASCRDIETGELLWMERLPGEYYSSPVATPRRVLFTNTEGVTTVVEAERNFKIRSVNDIGEPVLSSLAVTKSRLYIRGAEHLYSFSTGRRSSEATTAHAH